MRVAIAGAGGMGREALAWLRDACPEIEPVAFFVADATERPQGDGVDLAVVDSVDALSGLGVAAVVLGIGAAERRRAVVAELAEAGIGLLSVVHPSVLCGPGVSLGEGAIIAPGVVLSRDVVVSRGSIVNYAASIGHDGLVDEFAFIGPGAVLSGDVRVGTGALVGAGAVILPGRSIGDGATVGAGAVVTRDVGAGAVVAGNPARPLSTLGEGSR